MGCAWSNDIHTLKCIPVTVYCCYILIAILLITHPKQWGTPPTKTAYQTMHMWQKISQRSTMFHMASPQACWVNQASAQPKLTTVYILSYWKILKTKLCTMNYVLLYKKWHSVWQESGHQRLKWKRGRDNFTPLQRMIKKRDFIY